MGTFLQIFSSLGVVLTMSVGPFVSYTTYSIVFAAMNLFMSIPVLFLPDSPFFLYSKGISLFCYVIQICSLKVTGPLPNISTDSYKIAGKSTILFVFFKVVFFKKCFNKIISNNFQVKKTRLLMC